MQLNQEEKINTRKENIILTRQQQPYFQINYKKTITKDQKYQIIGGGCAQSYVRISNPKKINFSYQNVTLDSEFKKEVEKLTNKKNINENIEKESQIVAQLEIIKCLKQHEVLICRNINMYKSELIELIDIYLIYALTGSSEQEQLKQNEIQQLGSLLKDMKQYFEIESRQNPTYDLVFYFDILYRFNSTSIFKEYQNKNQLIQVAKFMTTIVKNESIGLEALGENFKQDFDLNLQGVRSVINTNKQSKTNQIFTYLLDIWVRKKDKFCDKVYILTLQEELQFNIQLFNELSQQIDYSTDLVILTLIKIDYYLSLALDDQNNLKILSQELSLNSDLIKVFIPLLIQKSDSQNFLDEMKYFLKFTVENHTYRFLTISILLKYKNIISDIDESNQYKQQIMEYLCYKYICEKDKSVKLAFETRKEFVDYFNSKIEKIQFKDKIIQFSNERSKILKNIVLGKYEEKIQNLYDIERMIANTIIEKWELNVKRRQQDNIAQKDDVLLEVQDLYIEQSITYLEGNKIIQPKLSQKQINKKDQSHSRSNALQEILDNFLIGHIQAKTDKNVNISSNKKKNRCKILGILAEGGTGKSMLIKKLETYLISSANDSEIVNYIPILIKCNSLHSDQPSIDNYLLDQGVTYQQINSIKKSERSKVILLDGYDEFTGEYFRVYKQLNLNDWKNTKVIVTSRKEKLELSDACIKFSLDDDKGKRDKTSFCIIKLEEFTNENISQYCKMYFRQYRTKEEIFDEQQYKNDLNTIEDCLKNPSLENLLYLPINLYLFTRMIVSVKDQNEIQKIKENISDQIGIQEIFFHEQFKREAQDFAQTCKQPSQRDQDFDKFIVNSFFEYFQSISMKMFENKGKPDVTNFLQIRNEQIQFQLQNQVENKLSGEDKIRLLEKIIHYVNSKIVTRSKEEIQKNKTNKVENKSYFIEFKHKSLFEYFVARAMKQDFDVHADNIYNLSIEQLKEFNINKKFIMNAGQNQSEQQILIKLYKMIKNEIETSDFYENYHLEQIEKNSRYIQYIKRSTIKNNRETSQIDIGASNILSVLLLSNFTYSKLEFNFCSFSKLYVAREKSDLINFDNCNLQNSYLQLLDINYDSCNISFATFDGFQKVFDTSNIFSFNKFIWDQSNILYTVTQLGFINSFKVVNQNIELQKSKQLSQTSLNQICIVNNDTLLVSTQYTLLLINSSSFDLIKYYKFKNDINGFTLIKENILVRFENETIFYGSFQNGFKKMNMVGSGSEYNESKQILLVYSQGGFSLYNSKENFEHLNTIQGHTNQIHSAAFSADGKYLATGSSDKTCKIWNAEKSFELINTIQGHTDTIQFVTFSTDGKYLATGSSDYFCKIWNTEKDFELINTIQGHTDTICFVAFSFDGKYLATGSKDNICKIWNAEKGFELINTIQGHTDLVSSVAFSADGKYLATGSKDNTCKIWNAEKGFELINTIEGHNQTILSVDFSADGKYLATGSKDTTCKIWNAEKGYELIKTIQVHSDFIHSVAFSADGKYLATGSWDKTCKIWNSQIGFELINTILGHTEVINSVVFSANGKYLATGSSDKTCKIWNAEKSFQLINTIQGHLSDVHSVAFSADGKYLATGAGDNCCKIWNPEKDFQLIDTIESYDRHFYSVAFSVDGKYLATCSQSSCKIWDAENGFEFINSIKGHTDLICSVAFSADRKYVATGSLDKTCKIWNTEQGFEFINISQCDNNGIYSFVFSADGKQLATGFGDNTCKIWNSEKGFEVINIIQGHNGGIQSVAFSADGKYLATCSRDKTCKIWNAKKGFELIYTIQGHSETIHSVVFSADGKLLATSSHDETCKIWNVENGFALIHKIKVHTHFFCNVAFSSDGKYLATGYENNICNIWNVEKGFELINKIKGHTDMVRSVAFSANGKYLATGSKDKTCKIWNVEKGFELTNTIQGHSEAIHSAVFSADGKYLLTGSKDKTCKIWNAEKGFQLINTIQCHTETLELVAFSLDGKYLATQYNSRSCKIWNAEKGFQLINAIQGQSDLIHAVDFSSDGKYLATGSKDNTCKIWNAEKGYELINTIQGHTDLICSVAFSADGKYLATGSKDNTCKIWNAEKGFELINTIEGHNQAILSVAFSKDGRTLCVLQNNKCYILLDLQNLKIISEVDQIYDEKLNEKYQFEKSENNFNQMRIFENMFIL